MDRGFSEFDLIDRLRRQASAVGPVLTGIGDDASVTAHPGQTATSVDAVVEGVHFRREWSSPAEIAAKAVAVALSDIAAMAADRGEVYVTLGLPADTERDFAEALADGFLEASRRFSTPLSGGDTVASPVLFAAITVVGRAPEGERLILRSGACEGDLVAVTGSLGGAAAGLLLLETDVGDGLDLPEREALIARQLSPEPKLKPASSLRGSGVTSLIDVSDGLLADLGHVADSSGVSIEIDADLIPIQPGVSVVASSAARSGLDLALAGGEDYELAMTFPSSLRESITDLFTPAGCPLTVIGKVVRNRPVPAPGSSGGEDLPGRVTVAGRDPSRPSSTGFDHFR